MLIDGKMNISVCIRCGLLFLLKYLGVVLFIKCLMDIIGIFFKSIVFINKFVLSLKRRCFMFVVFNVWSFVYFYFGYCILKIVGLLVYIFG